jgi:hypothetical protein
MMSSGGDFAGRPWRKREPLPERPEATCARHRSAATATAPSSPLAHSPAPAPQVPTLKRYRVRVEGYSSGQRSPYINVIWEAK